MLIGIPPYYNEDVMKLYENISKGKLKIPNYISKNAKSILLVSISLILVLFRKCCARILKKDQQWIN
jgi:hypothetical protein